MELDLQFEGRGADKNVSHLRGCDCGMRLGLCLPHYSGGGRMCPAEEEQAKEEPLSATNPSNGSGSGLSDHSSSAGDGSGLGGPGDGSGTKISGSTGSDVTGKEVA